MMNWTRQSVQQNKANFRAWFDFVHPAVTVLGWGRWHRARVLQRDVSCGIGILPMIHGLEAHATLVRVTRTDCYPVLNQANFRGRADRIDPQPAPVCRPHPNGKNLVS
jgi:hypothetical protein